MIRMDVLKKIVIKKKGAKNPLFRAKMALFRSRKAAKNDRIQ